MFSLRIVTMRRIRLRDSAVVDYDAVRETSVDIFAAKVLEVQNWIVKLHVAQLAVEKALGLYAFLVLHGMSVFRFGIFQCNRYGKKCGTLG